MYKDVLTTVTWCNKTETLGNVKEFYCSFLQCINCLLIYYFCVRPFPAIERRLLFEFLNVSLVLPRYIGKVLCLLVRRGRVRRYDARKSQELPVRRNEEQPEVSEVRCR